MPTYSQDETLMALGGLCCDYDRLSEFAKQSGIKTVYNPEVVFNIVKEWFDAFPETSHDADED